jgi:hypothetical protein
MRRSLLIAGWLATAIAVRAAAQNPPPPPALRVFLDCQAPSCDFDHFRNEITWVNWMRDRRDADVHVLITAEPTGGGGLRYAVEFLGRGRLEGQRQRLDHVAAGTDSHEERRAGLTRTLRLGFVPLVSMTPLARRLNVTYDGTGAGATAEHDPWNYWVFTARVGGFVEGESEQRFRSGNASVDATRTTEALRTSFFVNMSGSRSEFDIADTAAGLDTTIVSTRSSYRFEHITVWSLGPHWSFGERGGASRSSAENRDFAFRAGPAIEYNVFPYAESTRRQLTVRYTAGVAAFDYADSTIFGKVSEILPEHNLEVALEVTQPGGSMEAAVEVNQYLSDLAKHRLELFGELTLRIFRGLNLNLFGNIARVKDQLFLSAQGLTLDEILLQQRVRGTSFSYFMNVGLSYRFGSKFNNVVNPRMR